MITLREEDLQVLSIPSTLSLCKAEQIPSTQLQGATYDEMGI